MPVVRRYWVLPAVILTFALFLVFGFAATNTVYAATLPAGFTESRVGSSLGAPTSLAIAPDGRVFITVQGGNVRIIKNGSLLPAPFLTITTDGTGERGLLGIAFDPNFATNHFVYVYHTIPGSPPHNRISRYVANGDVTDGTAPVPILDLENLSATNHNGGAIHFGPDGKLYVAVGENAVSSNAQTLTNRLGKILRLNADGSIPADNPFIPGNGSSVTAEGDNQAIWAYGLRNPFTFNFQPGTGRMFINDVGAGSREEINDGIAGSNYGWPTCEGACSNPGFVNPLTTYTHADGCAIVGSAFYNPATVTFPADYRGDYFFADLCGGWIRRFDPSNSSVQTFATGLSSPVDLAVAPDGALYYLSRGAGGEIWRVQYTGTSNSPTPTRTATATSTRTATATGTRTSSPTLTRTNTPAGGTGTGLTGQYFDNADLTNLKLTRVDRQIDLNFANGSPDPLLAPDTFSIRWTGSIRPLFTEQYTFITTSDDGIRLWVNNQLIVNDWQNQPWAENRATINLTAGVQVPIQIEFFDGTGGAAVRFEWQSAHQGRQVVPAAALFPGSPPPVNTATFTPTRTNTAPAAASPTRTNTPPAASPTRTNTPLPATAVPTNPPAAKGLRGEYFGAKNLTNSKLVRRDAMIDFNWGNGSPDPSIANNTFSVRWTGFIVPAYTEQYTFIATSDDGVRLWLNDQLVIDNWRDQAWGEARGTFALTAGQRVSIRMEYYEGQAGAAVRLEWQSAHQGRQVIPSARLVPAANKKNK